MILTTFDRHVVLIVDDRPDNLSMLSDLLDESGHIVLVATDGMGALERLDRITPDLILLDAMMPGIDGFETCRRIKLIRNISHVPVVFMTGLSETEHVVRGFEVGGIDYVTKPIRPQEVVARIGAHIRTARMMSQTRGVLEHAAHAAIVLGTNGVPSWQTSKASLWLERYFPSGHGAAAVTTGTRLPLAVQAWLNESMARQRHGSANSGNSENSGGSDILPLVVQQGESELRITIAPAAPGPAAGHCLRLLLEEKRVAAIAPTPGNAEPAATLDGFRLTPRENDVLLWLGKGKTNRDIADILGMSPRTVNKHLEHIFVKLGVETRSAAAVLAANLGYPGGNGLLQ